MVWKPEDIQFDRSEVLRYLGYGPNAAKVGARIRKMVEQEMDTARTLISPRGYFRIVDAAPLRKWEYFSDAERVAFGVATIGEALETRVKALFAAAEGTRGVLLDAAGSAAAEAVTDLVNREVRRWAKRTGYRTTRRFSPGYGTWSVEGQELVFQHLRDRKVEQLGVTLTPSLLMVPLKSVSFAIKLGRQSMLEVNKGRCVSCALEKNCPFRGRDDVCRKASVSLV